MSIRQVSLRAALAGSVLWTCGPLLLMRSAAARCYCSAAAAVRQFTDPTS